MPGLSDALVLQDGRPVKHSAVSVNQTVKTACIHITKAFEASLPKTMADRKVLESLFRRDGLRIPPSKQPLSGDEVLAGKCASPVTYL